MVGLGRTIPSLPVRDIATAVMPLPRSARIHPLQDGEAVIDVERNGLYAELAMTDVLQSVSRDGVTETDFGTPEFATLDADGNLIEFFRWVR